MIENKYRLKDYIITEYDDLFCSWEMNIVLGEHRVGNCFIVGDILIIHSSGHQKNGCLKCEYQLGQLKIIVNSDGTLSWEKLDGLNKKTNGSCNIISGILFLESKAESHHRHETKSRRE